MGKYPVVVAIRNSKRERYQGSIAHISFSSTESCAILWISTRDRGLLHRKTTTVMGRLRMSQTRRRFSVFGQTSHQLNQMKRILKTTMMKPRTREAQLDKRWVNLIHHNVEALRRSTRRKRPPYPCHLFDREIRNGCRREDSLPCIAERARLFLEC